MLATNELCYRDPELCVYVDDKAKEYLALEQTDEPHIGKPAGIEVEMGELIYGLVTWLKPKNILETGTRGAIAARYMCLAMEHNGFGHLTTMERCGVTGPIGISKLEESGFSGMFTPLQIDSRDYKPNRNFDLMWLDSEPEYRLKELVQFYDNLETGGLAVIHDCGAIDSSAFGGLPQELRSKIREGALRAFTFSRGWSASIFQKAHVADEQYAFFA